jgi:NAD(P)H-dependent FMN reductase
MYTLSFCGSARKTSSNKKLIDHIATNYLHLKLQATDLHFDLPLFNSNSSFDYQHPKIKALRTLLDEA